MIYHGTTTEYKFQLLKPQSYCTNDLSVAKSYAEEKANAIGGIPIVYEVLLDVAKIVQRKPYIIYEADQFDNEMGFTYYINNVPVNLWKIVWTGTRESLRNISFF